MNEIQLDEYTSLNTEMNPMQSNEYEAKCKNALIILVFDIYGEKLSIDELQLVWFSKVLKNFKCVIIDLRPNVRYYECTYNGETDEIYIDIYQKQFNAVRKGCNIDLPEREKR